MTDYLHKFVSVVQSLRFRDVIIIFMLAMIALPVWLTWKIVEDPIKLGALVELKSGSRLSGTVRSCQIRELVYSSTPYYRIVKESSITDSDDRIQAGLYIESRTKLSIDLSRKACIALEDADNLLDKEIRDLVIK